MYNTRSEYTPRVYAYSARARVWSTYNLFVKYVQLELWRWRKKYGFETVDENIYNTYTIHTEMQTKNRAKY